MSTIVTVPTGRYIVTNQTRPLNNALEGDPVGVRLGVPATKPPHLQAWYLEDAPAAAQTVTASRIDKFPGMQLYILRTEKGNYFLEAGLVFSTYDIPTTGQPPQDPSMYPASYSATTTKEKHSAWVFVLDGEYSNGTFEGKLVSADGTYTLALQYDGRSAASPIGTAYMSPISDVNYATWQLQLSPLGEEK